MLIVIGTISSTKVRRSKGANAFFAGLMRFVNGFVASLSNGGSAVIIDKCAPADWKAAMGGTPEEPTTQIGGGAMEQPLRIILSILGIGLKLACMVKSKIIGFIQGKIRRRRRYYRFFMENGYGSKGF
jgi:hypothetical protein